MESSNLSMSLRKPQQQIRPPDKSNLVILDKVVLHEIASEILSNLILSGGLVPLSKDKIRESEFRERLQEISFN